MASRQAEVSAGDICIVGTFRGPLRETIMFVNYHLNMGIARLFLFFDDPNDPAIAYLAANPRVTCIRCNATYWASVGLEATSAVDEKQVANANVGLKMARDNSYEWIIHIDVDELLYSKEDIRKVLVSFPNDVDVVQLELCEAVPDKLVYNQMFKEVSTFRVPPTRARAMLARLLGCRAAFFKGEYFRAAAKPKSAIRTSAQITSMGVTRPRSKRALRKVKRSGLKVLHFDCCGLEDFKRKWGRRVDGSSVAGDLRPNRVQQMRAFASVADDTEGMSQLYRRLYFIPESEKSILRRCGLLTDISINLEHFAH